MVEIFKPIAELDGRYLISNTGKVFSNVSCKFRKPVEWGNGYYYIHARDSSGKDFLLPIHRLVAEYFIPNPNDLTQVNHIDGNKHNNHCGNLEWVTPLENTHHAIKMGLSPTRTKAVIKVSESGETERFDSIKLASERTGINYDNIRSAIYRGRKAGGFYWIFDTKELSDTNG